MPSLDYNQLMSIALIYGRPELSAQKMYDLVISSSESMEDKHLVDIKLQITKARDIFDKTEKLIEKEIKTREKRATKAKASGKDASADVPKADKEAPTGVPEKAAAPAASAV